MEKLKQEVYDNLREDEDLQLDIAKAMYMRVSTVKAWVRNKDPRLTSLSFLLLISHFTKLPLEELTEPELEPALQQ